MRWGGKELSGVEWGRHSSGVEWGRHSGVEEGQSELRWVGSRFYCPFMSSYLVQSLNKDYTCGLGQHKELQTRKLASGALIC